MAELPSNVGRSGDAICEWFDKPCEYGDLLDCPYLATSRRCLMVKELKSSPVLGETVLTGEDTKALKAFIQFYNTRISEPTIGREYVESRLLCSILARVRVIVDRNNAHTRKEVAKALLFAFCVYFFLGCFGGFFEKVKTVSSNGFGFSCGNHFSRLYYSQFSNLLDGVMRCLLKQSRIKQKNWLEYSPYSSPCYLLAPHTKLKRGGAW